MDNFDLAHRWLAKAAEDMRSAEVLLREDLISNSCYHSQQAAEKILKAYLALFLEEPPYTHNLGQLCKHCMDYDESFKTILNDASDLTEFAAQTRYPGDELYCAEDAENAIKMVQLIHEFTLPRINRLEQDTNQTSEQM